MREGWATTAIGNVCEIVNGGTPKTGVADHWGGNHLWITPAEMGRRTSPYVDQTARTLTSLGLQDSSARLLPPLSVILSSRAPIGHLVINTKEMATNQGCKGLVPHERLDHKFLFYYLGSVVDLLNDLGTGTTFKEISGGKLKEVPLPLPPLPEQKRIVAILDEAFEGIGTAVANAEKNLANARELFASYLNTFFRLKGQGWFEKKLGDLCDFEGGSQPPKSKFIHQETGGYVRFLQIRDFASSKNITYIPISRKNRMCKETDILIGRYGASVGKILTGKSGAYNVAIVKTIPNSRVVSRSWFYNYLISDVFQSDLSKVAERSAQAGFSKDDIYNFLVPVPSLTEQALLTSKIEAISSEVSRLEAIYQQKVERLAELKQSILQKAFAGELTARSANPVQHAAE